MSEIDIQVARALEERLVRIEARIESLDRSITLASGGLHVLIWLGGVAVAVAGFVVTVLTYLHLRREGG